MNTEFANDIIMNYVPPSIVMKIAEEQQQDNFLKGCFQSSVSDYQLVVVDDSIKL